MKSVSIFVFTWANHAIALGLLLLTNTVVLSVYFDGYSRQNVDLGLMEFLLNANTLIVVLVGTFILRDEIGFLYNEGGLELLHGVQVPVWLVTLSHLLPLALALLIPLALIQVTLPFVPYLWWITLWAVLLALLLIRGALVSLASFGLALLAFIVAIVVYLMDEGAKAFVVHEPVLTSALLIAASALAFWWQSRSPVHD
ncbi:MAG: hypothetical protein QXE80_09370 [Pyrobaculum sp.]